MPAETPATRSPPEVQQVLRYWLRAIRQAEALASRPRASRPPRAMPTIDLRDPGQGQVYTRLDATPDYLLRMDPQARVAMEPGVAVFFEHWLRSHYKAEFAIARGWAERDETVWLAGWPTIHLPRRGELACLLRFESQVRWIDANGKTWRPPTYGDRKAGRLPALPVQLELEAPPTPDDPDAEAPFSVDPHLLTRTLGVSDEELAELLPKVAAARTAATVVALLCDVLELEGAPIPPDLPADALLARLTEAVSARLPSGVGVWPVGLVYDASGQFATWHLQREMTELLRRPPGQAPWGKTSGLWSYLAGDAPEAKWQPLLGVRAPRGLTADQRTVAERFLATTLTAAQGPPGTGKTDLILNIAAHTLVERARGLADGAEMSDSMLLVCSTNNRAVDNVTEALTDALPRDRLPIALRTGSQQITANATADLLGRAMAWLSKQDERDAQSKLETALGRLRVSVDAYDARVAPIDRHRRRVSRLAHIERRLTELAAVDLPTADASEIERAIRATRRVRTRLLSLEDLFTRGGAEAVVIAARQVKRLNALDRPKLVKALASLDRTVGWSMPPELPKDADAETRQTAWEDTVADACNETDELTTQLLAWKAARLQVQRRAELVEEAKDLRALVADTPPPPDQAELDALASAIYERALAVRERWAVTRAKPLRQALTRAMGAAMEQRSLRKLSARAPEVETWLRRLFPVWGSTLLSLGNVLQASPNSVERLIIDEAGQCHPAYALSGLLRATHTLIIGDVHQLEPIIELTPADLQRAERGALVTLEAERLAPYHLLGEPTGASAQSLANHAVGTPLALHDHFRCQPEIIGLSDRLCGYGLKVRTPTRSLAERLDLLAAPLLFVPIRGAQVRARGSWVNEAEAEVAMQLLYRLSQAGIPWSQVAVLTPYVGQLDLLRTRLRAARVPTDGPDGLATGTVHRFQGGERAVVIFSTVVTRTKSLAFMDRKVNLVNVAVSRAMDHLVVLGDAETLRQGKNTQVLVESAVLMGH
jgi:hypothetical protein